MTATTAGHPALPDAIRRLLETVGLADAPVRFAAPSHSTVDTGGWLRRERVWLGVVGDRLVIAAPGPTPLLRALPLDALSRATYNHVTGSLAFPRHAAADAKPLPTIRLDPLVARSLLGLAALSSPGSPSHA